MGFLDKTSSKIKSSIATSKSSRGENKEVNSLQYQIREERSKVKENFEAIGKEYYEYSRDKNEEHIKTCDFIVMKIEESRKLIEGWEAQIESVREDGKAERENIKAETDAKIKEIEDNEAEAKAEKERQKNEKDNPF